MLKKFFVQRQSLDPDPDPNCRIRFHYVQEPAGVLEAGHHAGGEKHHASDHGPNIYKDTKL